MIIKDPTFSLPSLISSLSEFDPTRDLPHLLLVVRSLSYMAYNCLWVQKVMVEDHPVPIKIYRALMASKDPMISTEAVFHIIILTPTFDERKDGAEIVASGIRHFIVTLRTAIEEGVDELQIHICMFLR